MKSAELSPVQKVPFWAADGRLFIDPAVITRFLRECVGQHFCPTIRDFELFSRSNTLLDAGINAFQTFQHEGYKAEESAT